MPTREIHPGWGKPPWKIDFTPPARALPGEADFAVAGGGFTGLAAAAWLRRLAPRKSVVVLEAGRIGAGASGRTGGIALAETAAGDAPGLGDVLQGFQEILRALRIECELSLPGAWEIGRANALPDSKINWQDSGRLQVVKEVPGGTLDPGKLVSGLGRAAARAGAILLENSSVAAVEWGREPVLHVKRRGKSRAAKLRAGKVLFATNSLALELAGLTEGMHPRLTLAALSEPLSEEQLKATGLAERKPFYTVDMPYLWGRVMRDRSVIWGAGLVSAPDERNLHGARVDAAESAGKFELLGQRVRALHPVLADVRFRRRWGGPILFRDSWKPVFDFHPAAAEKWRNAIVLGAFAGHGVALSSYLGKWAAEALVEDKELPAWGKI
jgi:glycine/D-amino acid oxidase-like deaminating enzyme